MRNETEIADDYIVYRNEYTYDMYSQMLCEFLQKEAIERMIREEKEERRFDAFPL